MLVKVISRWNPQAKAAIDWFLEGDLSVVGNDTETMGRNWLRCYRELKPLLAIEAAAVEDAKVIEYTCAMLEKELLEKKAEWLRIAALIEAQEEDTPPCPMLAKSLTIAEAARKLASKMFNDNKPFRTAKRKVIKEASAPRKAKEKEMAGYAKEALDPKTNYLATLQLSSNDGRALVIIAKDADVVAQCIWLLDELKKRKPVWVFHNAKFDLNQFWHHWEIEFDDQTIHDTMVCESLIIGARNYDRVDLGSVTQRYPLPDNLKKIDCSSRLSNWWDDDLTDNQKGYASLDVLVLPELMRLQKEQMRKDSLLRVRKLECTLTPRLIKVEDVGVQFNRDKLSQFLISAKEARNKQAEVAASVFGAINTNSPDQVLKIIESKYGVTPMASKYNKETGQFEVKPSTDKFALLQYGLQSHKEVKAMLAMKELTKNITMAEKWLAMPNNTLKVDYMQVALWGSGDDDGGTRTGRMSTSPQLQNIANFMKQFIEAEEGWVILSSDYAAIELRIIAEKADVQAMKSAFIEDRSLHKEMCVRAFGMKLEEVNKKSKQYRIAKESNFGFPYGMGAKKFGTQVMRATEGDIRLDEAQCQKFRADFFGMYPEIDWWHQRQLFEACTKGYIESGSGRRRYYNKDDRPVLENQYKKLWSPYDNRWIYPETNLAACFLAADWRWRNIGFNMPVQGTGADGAKDSLRLLIDRSKGAPMRTFGMVHDSFETLVREDYVDKAALTQHGSMIDGMQPYLKHVPVVVEHTVGKCWAAPPPDIEADDYGLWVRPSSDVEAWMKTELQQELTLSV